MASLQASAGALKGGARVTVITPPGIIRSGYSPVTMRAVQRPEVGVPPSRGAARGRVGQFGYSAPSRTDGRWPTN
jgi:hypothetical protein